MIRGQIVEALWYIVDYCRNSTFIATYLVTGYSFIPVSAMLADFSCPVKVGLYTLMLSISWRKWQMYEIPVKMRFTISHRTVICIK